MGQESPLEFVLTKLDWGDSDITFVELEFWVSLATGAGLRLMTIFLSLLLIRTTLESFSSGMIEFQHSPRHKFQNISINYKDNNDKQKSITVWSKIQIDLTQKIRHLSFDTQLSNIIFLEQKNIQILEINK